MRLILLNGPPRSGKDTAGEMIAEAVVGARCDKFARIVKERTHAAYGLMGREGLPLRHDHFEHFKDEPRVEFLRATPRQAYIAFSEKFYKPLHGNAVFGQLLAQSLAYSAATVHVITDSGFREEAEALLHVFGAENALLVRLHRGGCSFANDSRGYIELHDLGVESVDVWNPGDADGLRTKLERVVPGMAPTVSDQPRPG